MMRQQLLPYTRSQADANQLGGPARARRTFPAGAGLALSLALALLAWKALILLRNYPTFILPAPELVVRRLIDELAGGTLRYHAALTTIESLGGFSLALVVSLALGYLLAHAPRLERVLAPQLAATQAVPVV